MASSYIGLNVSLSLSDSPHPLLGTITDIDVARNLLVLSRQGGGEQVQVDKGRIKGISIVPAAAPAQSKQDAPSHKSQTSAVAASAGSGSSSGQDFRAPEATNLPIPSAVDSGGRGGQAKDANGTSRRKKKKKAKKVGVQEPVHQEQAREQERASSSLSEDFDFEASAKSFDKAAIWEQIRAQDTSDPAALLVSHNRRSEGEALRGRLDNAVGGGEGGKMRKLRIDENVLSPSPERERGEEEGRLSSALTDTTNEPSTKSTVVASPPTRMHQAPSHETTATVSSSSEIEIVKRENALLKRRLFVLEGLSGLSVRPSSSFTVTSTSTEEQIELECALSPPALPTNPPTKAEPATFYLGTTLNPVDPKLRFKPASAAASSNGMTAGSSDGQGRVPEKYNREMGLRLDNGSARVFIERLRGAL